MSIVPDYRVVTCSPIVEGVSSVSKVHRPATFWPTVKSTVDDVVFDVSFSSPQEVVSSKIIDVWIFAVARFRITRFQSSI